jgi:serine/threonine protein kinase
MALIRRTLNISSSSSTHVRTFSYKELAKATARFTNVIGTGGSGVVYKGMLPSGVAIAVKQQQCGDDSSKDSDEQMLQEIKILSELSHPHLLPLLGYYMPGLSKRRMMLVYEYMPKGTLEDHLFGQFSHHRALGWRTRVRIAYESASAIAYLHTQVDNPMLPHWLFTKTHVL